VNESKFKQHIDKIGDAPLNRCLCRL